jgi:chromosome segregation protein
MLEKMVRINKLVMQGFKSFQKKTAIPLFEGFNALIGPNGSGKTAILDALCFVLGRSSKTLRGDRMDHIIFNGGYGKKPAEHAIVSLHLANKNNIIPNAGEEVIVSRRVNRRGNSTYRLNGKVVNRSRILEVLRYGRIDPYGHNIIQQGEITNVIEMKPRQRREIIDEVAGIREYNEKKERALKELEKAQIKLNESSVLMDEKRQQLDKLKRERDQALKYKNLEKEVGKLRATLAFSRVKIVEGEMENITRNLEIKEGELKNLENKVDEFDDSLPEAEKRIKEIGKEIMRKSVNKELRKEIEEINNEVLIKEGKVNSNRREIERIEDMISRLTQLSKREIRNEAVKALLNKEGVFGTISTLSEIDNKYRVAMDIVAGARLNDIVVDSENNAIGYISYLKSNNLGRVRFLPLDRLNKFEHSGKAEIASNMEGIIGFAVNLLKYDKKYDIAFKHVFRDTLIAENIEAARRIKGIRVVTLDGDLFEAGGAISGG